MFVAMSGGYLTFDVVGKYNEHLQVEFKFTFKFQLKSVQVFKACVYIFNISCKKELTSVLIDQVYEPAGKLISYRIIRRYVRKNWLLLAHHAFLVIFVYPSVLFARDDEVCWHVCLLEFSHSFL